MQVLYTQLINILIYVSIKAEEEKARLPKPKIRTLDNTREKDETVVKIEDEEVS